MDQGRAGGGRAGGRPHPLRFNLRDQVTLGPWDDGTAQAFDASLDRTVEHLRALRGGAR